LGLNLAIAGDVRAQLAANVASLDPSDTKTRTLLKIEARARTPLIVRDMITFVRPGVGPRAGSVGRANVANSAANLGGRIFRVGGRAILILTLIVDAGRIFFASDRPRTAVVVTTGAFGALGGGALGALGGSAAFPGPGTVAGGIAGAATGGVAGEALGARAFDFLFR